MGLTYQIKNIIETDRILIKKLEYEEVDVSAIDTTIFNENELKKYQSFISDKRRREFYFTRVLLKSFNVDCFIEYHETGRPFIRGGHIGISHSRNTVIIGYSEHHIIGLDIEYYNPKIHRIKHKFLATLEKERFDTENEEILTLLWSLKEAIYKLEDIPGLLFKEHIVVQSLSHRGKVLVTKNNMQHEYLFDYLIFNEFVITYCQLVKNELN
ncbi:4'-phosphopantetheinyl transferase superfamily protein [Paracrocinitomix mangrovi]|uniref:4'-phosphopantetheinyl transferase family protein n=1 Tax=Paracrocinitomix mangrovi TaxID=2862509 RepID=UPI001C8D351A|nr:4'-phosphopantetheinyl transferase superfamily protein [Paracrocinitomix mangrovi]UKN03571.1 4'-phosphopantetheinyl transferase superfamily protein [Paracrocinitomix mangrovi]